MTDAAAPKSGLVPNRPTPEGREIGAHLARLTEKSLAKLKLTFPNHAEPCQSCAFRRDTIPNGCPETVLDAMKCVVEGVDFMCHQKKDAAGRCTDLCTGYLIAVSGTVGLPPMKCPWPFSHEAEDEAQ